MGAREPRASPLRPRPPPSSPELGGRGGRGRPLRRQTPVELKDTAWGSGGGAPRTCPRRVQGVRRAAARARGAARGAGESAAPGSGCARQSSRQRRARRTRGYRGPLGAGEGGTEAPDAAGLEHCALRESGDPGPGRGVRPIRPACGVALRPPGAEGTRSGKGRRRRGGGGSARTRNSKRPTAVPASRPPPHPAYGPGGVSGDVTGGDYSLVRAVVRPPLTGWARGGGGGPPPPGRPHRAAPSAPQPAPRADASPPRAPPAAKFGSTLRRALTPCPFHLPPGPRRSRRTRRRPERSPGAPNGDSDSGEGTRRAREWSPTGIRAALLGDPAGAGRSPPGSHRGRPDLGGLNRNCSSIDSAALGERPGACAPSACGRQKGRKSVFCSEGGGTKQATEPSLFMCLPAFAFFASRLQGASLSCVPRV